MNNPVLMVLLLGLLMIALVAPFSALSVLMLVLLGSAFLWTLSTLIGTIFRGLASEGTNRKT